MSSKTRCMDNDKMSCHTMTLVTIFHRTYSIIICRWTLSVNQFHVDWINPGVL